jgi:8-oxo-dGTP pyrophosphatase MutT (NUDIX family)
VNVRAVIWLDGQLVVNRVMRRGSEWVTLPGGRIGSHEPVKDALAREVLEETGLTVEVGQLLGAGEVLNATSLQELELFFAARPDGVVNTSQIELVDPHTPAFNDVLPAVGAFVDDWTDSADTRPIWLGNLWVRGRRAP